MESGGEVPFTSSKVAVTAEVYQPEEPAVPLRTARDRRETLVIVPFTTEKEVVGSMFPATSMESDWTTWEPTLLTRNGSVEVVTGPASTPNTVLATPAKGAR